jgi:DnaJ-class molecular chaperone
MKDIDPNAYDAWLARDYEYLVEPETKTCPECDGDGLKRVHYPEGDPQVVDDPCNECDGEGRVEVDVEAERSSAAEDAAMEKYHHDKYGD